MKFSTTLLVGFSLLRSLATAFPSPFPAPSGLASKRADSNLVGYLGAFFLGDEPSVYFYLSNGNDAISFAALNGGDPILIPTLGTGGVRDPAIVSGGGNEAGKKWYIIGTDLDISKVSSSCRVVSEVGLIRK